MTDDTIRVITIHTNERMTEFLEENPVDFAKYTYFRLADEIEVRVITGLLYLRVAFRQNLQDINNLSYHESANEVFIVTMDYHRFFLFSLIYYNIMH